MNAAYHDKGQTKHCYFSVSFGIKHLIIFVTAERIKGWKFISIFK